MTYTNENTETKEFATGPAALYMAGGRIPEAVLESPEYAAGTTDGGLRLSYSSKTRELYDVEGNSAGTLRYGESLKINGKLCRLTAAAVNCFAEKRSLSVLVVCPLPDGDQLRLYLKGGLASSTTLDASLGGTTSFEIIFGRGVEHPTLRMAQKGGSL